MIFFKQEMGSGYDFFGELLSSLTAQFYVQMPSPGKLGLLICQSSTSLA